MGVVLVLAICLSNNPIVYATNDTNIKIVDNDFNNYSEVELVTYVSDFVASSFKYYSIYGYDSIDTSNVFIEGPFKIYSLYDDGVVRVKTINYHIIVNNKVRNVVSLYLNKQGALTGQQSTGYASKINTLPDRSLITLVVDYRGLYALSSNNTKVILEDFNYINNITNKTDLKTKHSVLTVFDCGNILKYNGNFKAFERSYKPNYSITPSRSVTIPFISQENAACHNACIAAVVRVREPNLFGDLTATEVSNTIGELTIQDRADFIKTKMHDYYLDIGDYAHYSVAYDYALSISSYTSMINNNTVLIGVFLFDDGNYHASVMYDYTLISGGVIVYVMDPFKGLVSYSWTGGEFTYSFSTYDSITLDEYVLSYY